MSDSDEFELPPECMRTAASGSAASSSLFDPLKHALYDSDDSDTLAPPQMSLAEAMRQRSQEVLRRAPKCATAAADTITGAATMAMLMTHSSITSV